MNKINIVMRFLGIPVKLAYKLPETISNLTEKQYLVLVRYLNGQIKEYKVIASLYNISRILALILSFKSFWCYKLIECIESLCDFSKSCDLFLIRKISGTKLYCENDRFKGISFMQFMFADTMYTQYLQSQKEIHLYSFIAAIYMKKGEQFDNIEIDKRIEYIAHKRIDRVVMEAILLNYMMLKKWLTAVYPYMFSSSEKDGSNSPQKQQKWLDIFDAFVGEQIPDTDYYKNMPCMDAFRIINRRLKDYYNGPKQ